MYSIRRKTALVTALSLSAAALTALAYQEHSSPDGPHSQDMNPHAMHATAPHAMHAVASTLSFTELQQTASDLQRARQATSKYQDVHAAEAAGYQKLGGDFPGMGTHYVLTMEPTKFDIEKPPILLYVKTPDSPGGYTLAGVGYLFDAPAGPDGQPLNPPFPKSLALWHQHDNLCMLPNLDNPHSLTESQCREKGGHFTAKTPWLVHAWIWKDNPQGVFSPENPSTH
jgi:hypothetical protein